MRCSHDPSGIDERPAAERPDLAPPDERGLPGVLAELCDVAADHADAATGEAAF